jgi:hypothetical protein
VVCFANLNPSNQFLQRLPLGFTGDGGADGEISLWVALDGGGIADFQPSSFLFFGHGKSSLSFMHIAIVT